MSSPCLIAPMTGNVRAYVRAFDLHAVCQYADGRIAVVDTPAGAAEAFWCEGRRDAHIIARTARATGSSIPNAARELHLRVGAHAHVVDKSEAAVTRLNESLVKANGDGTLRVFNRLYRSQREAARAQGRGYMSYAQARNRLLRVLAQHAAGTAPASVFTEVLTER
jgi:hypothetical protein